MGDTGKQDPSKKIVELENKYKNDPDSRIFAQLAEEYRKAGLFEKSIEVCIGGLKKHENYATALVTLGHVYIETKQWDEACRELEKAIELAPENILANKLLGIALENQGKREEALLLALKKTLSLMKHGGSKSVVRKMINTKRSDIKEYKKIIKRSSRCPAVRKRTR